MAEIPILSQIAAQRLVDQLAARPIDPTGTAPAKLLGLTYAPGEIVRDRVTGETVKVLHAQNRAVRRPAARPAKS